MLGPFAQSSPFARESRSADVPAGQVAAGTAVDVNNQLLDLRAERKHRPNLVLDQASKVVKGIHCSEVVHIVIHVVKSNNGQCLERLHVTGSSPSNLASVRVAHVGIDREGLHGLEPLAGHDRVEEGRGRGHREQLGWSWLDNELIVAVKDVNSNISESTADQEEVVDREATITFIHVGDTQEKTCGGPVNALVRRDQASLA